VSDRAQRISYRDKFVGDVHQDIGRLLHGDSVDAADVERRLRVLARANSSATEGYWHSYGDGLGVPDTAYKTNPPYLFPDQEPARVFQTSNTTGTRVGQAPYSARGMELMEASILRNMKQHAMGGLTEPAVIRLVPPPEERPAMVMAFGMELVARRLGHPRLSGCVVTGSRIDHPLLIKLLDSAIAEQHPVVLIGATSIVVNLCEAMKEHGRSWQLPPGSRLVDAGGSKRARRVTVDEVRTVAADVFGVAAEGHRNVFGMTELASQLHDAADVSMGPAGERPKGSETFVRAQVRDAADLSLLQDGLGLLEVIDLCLLDRPCALLTGDRALAGPSGVAVVGRVSDVRSRGCSLTLDQVSTGRRGDA